MSAAGYEPELLQEAGRAGLESVGSLIKKQPPPNWISEHVSLRAFLRSVRLSPLLPAVARTKLIASQDSL